MGRWRSNLGDWDHHVGGSTHSPWLWHRSTYFCIHPEDGLVSDVTVGPLVSYWILSSVRHCLRSWTPIHISGFCRPRVRHLALSLASLLVIILSQMDRQKEPTRTWRPLFAASQLVLPLPGPLFSLGWNIPITLTSSATNMTPFMATYDFQPPFLSTREGEVTVPSIKAHVTCWREIWVCSWCPYLFHQAEWPFCGLSSPSSPPYQQGQRLWISTPDLPYRWSHTS